MIRKALAFIQKDLLIASTYKISFLLGWARVFASLLPFYFISKLFLSAVAPELERYGGAYFPFVLIGIAFRRYLTTALSAFQDLLWREQAEGTVEILLLSPTPVIPLFILLSIGRLLLSLLELFLYFFLGVCLFGVSLDQMNFPLALLILGLTTIAFYGFGILSCAFFIVFKQTNPLTFVFGGLSSFFGGVYFPIEIFPKWLQRGAELFPLTYVLRAMRLTLLRGGSFDLLRRELLALTVLAFTLFPLSLWVLRKAMEKAKRDGTLAHF